MAVELFLSAVAGAAAAAAATRLVPSRSRAPRMGASPRIRAEVSSLESRKRILEKSIVRLNAGPMGLTDAQRDALLARYQRELGELGVRLEALEEASRHPDLGALGDGLATIMDRRLSEIDEKFGRLSAQIASAQPARAPSPARKAPGEPRAAAPPGQAAPRPRQEARRMELTTLTSVPAGAAPQPFTPLAPQGTVPQGTVPQGTAPPAAPRPAPPGPAPVPEAPATPPPSVAPAAPEPPPPVPGPEIRQPARDEELDVPDDDSDEEDLARIKRDILKTLNRLDQAEVE